MMPDHLHAQSVLAAVIVMVAQTSEAATLKIL
jgi:hypothetical protein